MHPVSLNEEAQPATSITPLEHEFRAALPTDEAARHLNRAEQTLRIWACRENGPLRPLRINGRLAWKTADIRALLGMSA
jgi:hypothetical protein